MPAYDAASTIRAAVDSALAQTDERIELIVIDDGSAILVSEVLAAVVDPRLKIVRHAHNRGLSVALNTGLRQAHAPFLSQLDADDEWDEDYVETILPLFEDPGVGLVYSNARLVGHPGLQKEYIQDPSVHPLDTFPEFAEQNSVPSVTATMRTEAVRAVGGYATWLRHAMDYQLYAKLIMAGWRFAYVDRCLASYSWPGPNRGMSWDTRTTELSELKLWLAFAARHPTVPGPRRQVWQRLRRELERVLTRSG